MADLENETEMQFQEFEAKLQQQYDNDLFHLNYTINLRIDSLEVQKDNITKLNVEIVQLKEE